MARQPITDIAPRGSKGDVENVVEQEIKEILRGGRIEAEIVFLPTDKPLDAIKSAISPSALLFVGFEPVGEDNSNFWLPFMEQIVDLLGDVILTYNASDVSLED